jgi:hypothetical protein
VPAADQPALFDAGPGPVKRIRRSADVTIRAARKTGRLEEVDTLLVALLRTCADRCDELRGREDAAFHEAQALRLTGELEARLRSIGGPQTDAFDQLLAAATGTAPPGHPA